MIAESHRIRIALASEVQALGAEAEQGTTTSGKIYRAWMDVKAVFTGHDRHTVLENCEAGDGDGGIDQEQERPAELVCQQKAGGRGQAVEKPMRGDDETHGQAADVDRGYLRRYDPGDRANSKRKRHDEQIHTGF